MSKTFDSSLLSGYLDGELEADEKALVERVLEEQPERRRQLDHLKRLQQSLAALPAPQPTRDPVESVRQRIDRRTSSTVTSSDRRWLHLVSLALAACLLLAVGWAIFGGSGDAPQIASEGSPEADSKTSLQDQTMLAPRPSASEQSARGRAARDEAAESLESVHESDAMHLRNDAPASQMGRGGRLADGLEPPPTAELRQRAEPAAPMPLRRSQEEPAAAMGMSAADRAGEPLRPHTRDAIVLRYVIPASEQDETVRWLHEIAPQDVVALPSVAPPDADDASDVPRSDLPAPPADGEASSRSLIQPNRALDFADVAEDTVGDFKRFWFRGNPAEQRALRLAIENRARATEAELKIVPPTEAASRTLDADGMEAAMKKSRFEAFSGPDAPQSDQEPGGILIELIVRPTP